MAVALVLGLLLGVVLPPRFIFSGSSPVVAGRDLKPLMRVPVGVDVDGNRVDDWLDARA